MRVRNRTSSIGLFRSLVSALLIASVSGMALAGTSMHGANSQSPGEYGWTDLGTVQVDTTTSPWMTSELSWRKYQLAFVALLPGEYLADSIARGVRQGKLEISPTDSVIYVSEGTLRYFDPAHPSDFGAGTLFAATDEKISLLRNETNGCTDVVVATFSPPGGGGGFVEPASGPMTIDGKPCGYLEGWIKSGQVTMPPQILSVGMSVLDIPAGQFLPFNPMTGGTIVWVESGTVTVNGADGSSLVVTPRNGASIQAAAQGSIVADASSPARLLVIHLLGPDESTRDFPGLVV